MIGCDGDVIECDGDVIGRDVDATAAQDQDDYLCRLQGLLERNERVSVLPNDARAVAAFIRARARATA